MPANRLYHTWFERIRQLSSTARKTTIRNFTWLLVGIYLSRSVHLSLIANKIPGRAKLNSVVQRLSRLLQSTMSVRQWYGPLGEELLQSQAQHGHIRLIVDGSKVSFHHQLLMVSIAYRRRAIPIVWTWVKGKRGHSSSIKQLALLRYVYNLIPQGVSVSIVGDSEFGAVAILRQLDTWQWPYVLRQKGDTCIDLTLHNHWQPFGAMARPGQSLWLGRGFLTKEHVYATHLLAHWQAGEKEPWLLATSLASRQEALRAYRRRMWIEIVFTQMTKTHLFAAGVSGNHVADLNVAVGNHHAVDQQLDQSSLLLKGGLGQTDLDSAAKALDGGTHLNRLRTLVSLLVELLGLFFQALVFSFHVGPSALVFRQRDHIVQIGLGETVQLVLQRDLPTAEILPACL